MLKLAGYVDRLSARPGEALQFKLSNATGEPVAAELVRVICADANPAAGGIRTERVPVTLPSLDVAQHPVPRGSYATVDLGDACAGLRDFTLLLTIKPTARSVDAAAASMIIDIASEDASRGIDLSMDPDGSLLLMCAGHFVKSAPVPLAEWVDVAATYHASTNTLTLSTRSVGHARAWQRQSAQADADLEIAMSGARLHIGGLPPGHPFCQFDGRIESPRFFPQALSQTSIDDAFAASPQKTDALFAFDFSIEPGSSRIMDIGPNAFIGQLINHPTRAMRSSRWTGREMCFRHAPSEYAAIHFHSDDMTDCHWPTALEWQVPDDLPSGCYALNISAGGERDNIPFFIVPKRGAPTAKIAVLVSTFTYAIYANHARPEWLNSDKWRERWRAQAAEWGAYPHNPGDHPEYAWSTYNNHVDGSGIAISSWHRPMLNTRIGYITYHHPEVRGSGLRHYPADTHLHAWLEDQGYVFDIITDQELHDEGCDLLKDYAVVVTGTHPEYHTREMLDALAQYRDTGGRFMYLGGNGFYWKIALDPEKPGVIEIRRGEGGIRAWAAEPGEYYNQFDGEYGGLWRRNGRPPQHLCGVGFSAQGNFVGSHYIEAPDVRASRAGWILDGVEQSTFGGHGLSGHGAAGFELDRADKALGTPAHAVVLATSEGHEPEAPWVLVPEERLTHITTIPGQSEQELIHSDIVFFETPGGGAVFSVGSITYCGSLLTNGGDNDISRLTKNVLDRFADPTTKFKMPARS